MFTGIIETMAEVISLEKKGSNIDISLKSGITNEFKIDQSISHNGVCLTVIDIDSDIYTVTVIKETLEKSNIGFLEVGDKVNLERSMKVGERLDGHIVQGHVDQKGKCTKIVEEDGSWIFTFHHKLLDNITVEKGSVCVNGVSLTVINSGENYFSVAIIPYTFENTNFNRIEEGSLVNIEFDIVGKYIAKMAYLLPENIANTENVGENTDLDDRDTLFDEVARLVVSQQLASISFIQRRMKIGYNRAGKIINELEAAGIVDAFEGSKSRKVLIKHEFKLEELLNKS